MPLPSVSKTEMTKLRSQYSSMMQVLYSSTALEQVPSYLMLATVSSLPICEFIVINKSCLFTCVSDTDRGKHKIFQCFSSPGGNTKVLSKTIFRFLRLKSISCGLESRFGCALASLSLINPVLVTA